MFDELREMNSEIRKKQEQLDELRALATSMTRPYSNDRVQTSPTDRLSNLMCKIIILENEIDCMVDDYADEKQRVKMEIYRIENEAWQDIVYAHFIERKTFGEIARQRGETAKAVSRKCERGVKYLKNIDRGAVL